ncbi:MAG: uroporphyrinogen-III C-methyltransferase [Xanthomonadales bacterium]|nr:uroporphyrinogen-III C-methyltransferase [Xanthomonadales bacterium]
MKLEISSMDTKPGERAADPVRGREERTRGGGSAVAVLALLVALSALAGAAWLGWRDWAVAGPERQRLADQVARVDASDGALSAGLSELRSELGALAAADGGAALAELRRGAAADRARLAATEQSLAEQQALSRSLQSASAALYERMLAAEAALARQSARDLDAAEELDLAEVDYLLRLASERLQLFADPAAADRALEVADRHLAAIDNPAYFGVRQKIAASRQSLAQVPAPDHPRMAAELDGIQAAIAAWPFAGAPEPAPGSGAAAETGWWDRLKQTLASLVTVRRSAPDERALSLEDQDYLRQRVWLQLEVAHLSLMRRDQQAFRAALARAQDSLAAWFDADDAAVRAASLALAGLAGEEIEVALPDITEPWTALRLIRASVQPKAAETPPEAPADSPGESPAESPAESSAEPALESSGEPTDDRQ